MQVQEKRGRPRLEDSPLRRYWREQKRKEKERKADEENHG